MLRAKFFSPEQLEALVRDYRNAGLDATDVALMAFAEKVALHAYKISQKDIDQLRSHGFSDVEILDIALTAGVRCFWGKAVDAIGSEPDAEHRKLEEPLRKALTVGRPFVEKDQGPGASAQT